MTIPSSDTEQRPQPGSDADDAPSIRADARRRTRRLALHFVIVSCGASALAGVLWGARAGLSAALGVGLAGANLLLMQKITQAMMAGAGGGGSAAWGLALPFKLVALVGVAYALVRGGVAQPVPLAMGFALLPLTGVFLPRPTSVAGLDARSRGQRLPSHPAASSARRGAPKPRQSQPVA